MSILWEPHTLAAELGADFTRTTKAGNETHTATMAAVAEPVD